MTASSYVSQEIEMAGRSGEIPQRNVARAAGVLYLFIIAAGIFAEFFVRQTLIVPGDAGTTAAGIMASESLFRAGIAADLVMIIADIGIALLFYVLLRHVSRALALLAAFFRLAQAATLGINLLNLMFVLELLGGAAYLNVFETEQLHALALPFLTAHGISYSLALVFFGVSILVLGYLLYESVYFPRILGVLLVVASLGYLLDSFAKVLLVDYAAYQPIFDMAVFMPAFIAELVLCLWLLVKGVNVPQPDTSVTLSPA